MNVALAAAALVLAVLFLLLQQWPALRIESALLLIAITISAGIGHTGQK
jgi:hypothetical protein